tara:strand:+ start:227 stop:508 length:282 start_codon:yes stop_codon:yes gene_type:complete
MLGAQSSRGIDSVSITSLSLSKSLNLLSIQLFTREVIGLEALYIKKVDGKALKIPTIGVLKSNLPAFKLNNIIKKDGTIILATVFIDCIQPYL